MLTHARTRTRTLTCTRTCTHTAYSLQDSDGEMEATEKDVKTVVAVAEVTDPRLCRVAQQAMYPYGGYHLVTPTLPPLNTTDQDSMYSTLIHLHSLTLIKARQCNKPEHHLSGPGEALRPLRPWPDQCYRTILRLSSAPPAKLKWADPQ